MWMRRPLIESLVHVGQIGQKIYIRGVLVHWEGPVPGTPPPPYSLRGVGKRPFWKLVLELENAPSTLRCIRWDAVRPTPWFFALYKKLKPIPETF